MLLITLITFEQRFIYLSFTEPVRLVWNCDITDPDQRGILQQAFHWGIMKLTTNFLSKRQNMPPLRWNEDLLFPDMLRNDVLDFLSVPEPPGCVSSGECLLREQVWGEDDAPSAVPTRHGRVSQTHATLQVLRQRVRLRHNPGWCQIHWVILTNDWIIFIFFP